VAPWLFRLTVFVAFMCGGALAQHYFAATPPSQAEPAQEHKGIPTAVLPQATRLPELPALDFGDAPLEPPAPYLAPHPSSLTFAPSSRTVQVVARARLPFDALAPPVTA
jgi:hypothetical protein